MTPWRGPFRVAGRRGAWTIVDRAGNVERLGYRDRADAREVVEIFNAAHCPQYRPDHNGECLNCDEPLDGHPDDPANDADA